MSSQVLSYVSMAINLSAECIFVIAAGSRQDHGRIVAIRTGSRQAQQGILKYHNNFSLISAVYGPIFKQFSAKLLKYTPDDSPYVGSGSNIFLFSSQ